MLISHDSCWFMWTGPTTSSVTLPEGSTLKVNVKRGENDPAKKTPVEPKRSYNKIDNWEEGCPYCGKILPSYNLYRQDVSYRCDNKPNQTKQNLRIA